MSCWIMNLISEWRTGQGLRCKNCHYSGGEQIMSPRDSAQSQERRQPRDTNVSTCSRTCLEFHILRQT